MNAAMPSMMPMMGNMMGAMNPMMMSGMMPMSMPMMGGMPGMAMPMLMCKMTCTMTANGMTCEMSPMDAGMKDVFMQCCQNMMTMMNAGIPMMANCGGMMMCMMPAGMTK